MSSPYGPDGTPHGGAQPAPFSDDAVRDEATHRFPAAPNSYDQTGFSQQAYSQQTPIGTPTGPTVNFSTPQFADPRYASPGAVAPPYGPSPSPARRSSVGMILGIGAAVVIALVVLAVVAFTVLRKDSTPTTAGTPWISATLSTSTSPSGATSGQEAQFRAGDFAQTPPTGETPTSRFLTGYATPDDWLRDKAKDNQITTVFTADRQYNSGISSTPAATQPYAAAAYKAQYYKTIFIYWTPSADDSLKEFMLAFGYAGAKQWWEHFDVMQSASTQIGSTRPTELAKVLNDDAVCRVLSWGGYSQSVADQLGGCPTTSWSNTWLEQQIKALGVTVTDY